MSTKQKISNVSLFKKEKVVAHAFSPDGKYIALSLKDSAQVRIYELGENISEINDWIPKWTLKDFSMTVSVLEWSVLDRLLTGSFDKSSNDSWDKQLTVVWNTRAIIDGQWSPNGKKFTAGTGCCKVLVGYYDSNTNWWSTIEVLSKCKSTVLQVRWHPSGRVVAAGSADYSVYLVTAVIKEGGLQSFEDDTYTGPYSSIDTQSEVLFRYIADNWVSSLAFSSNGELFVFGQHSGILAYVTIKENDLEFAESDERFITPPTLPFNQLSFIDNQQLIAGGFDRKPALLKITSNGWDIINSNEPKIKIKDWEKVSFIEQKIGDKGRGQQSLVNKMINKTMLGSKNQNQVEEEGTHLHQTPIIGLRQVPKQNGVFSTNDINGDINFWKV